MANVPAKIFRIGSCVAKVWFVQRSENEPPFRVVTIARQYRAEDGNMQSSSTFTLRDLPAAVKVLEMALDEVARHEAVTENESVAHDDAHDIVPPENT